MIINIAEGFSQYHLLLLDKYQRGRITASQYEQYNMTLLLWLEKRDFDQGYPEDDTWEEGYNE